MADRLYIGSQYKGLIDELDKIDFLNIKSNGERSDLYLIALSLGVSQGVRTSSKSKEGIILEHVAKKSKEPLMSFIYSVALHELRKEKRENQVIDTDVVYNIAEEYANTGFEMIKKMIPDFSKYDKEEFEYSLIEMMDEIILR